MPAARLTNADNSNGPLTMRPLTHLQFDALCSFFAKSGTFWYAGRKTDDEWFEIFHGDKANRLATLSKRGLCEQKPTYKFFYRPTELTAHVLCAYEFDRGLEIGFKGWCREVDAARERDAILEREEEISREVAAGLRYPKHELDNAEMRVRDVIWKNVKRE